MANTRSAGIAGVVVNAVAGALADLRPPRAGEVMFDDDTQVPAEVADALFDDAAAALDEPAIGLVVARKIPPGALGLLDYALFTGDTWGEAIRRVARFYAAATERVTMEIEEDDAEGRLILNRQHRGNRHWVEFSFAVITERARQAVGSTFRLGRVDFAHAAPHVRAMHERYFGADVAFDQPVSRLVFDRSLLGARLRTGALSLATALEQRLGALVATSREPLLVRIRSVIKASLSEKQITIDQVAAEIGTSPRSLQRDLRELGSGFRELVDEVRRDEALTLLRGSALSITEIGAKLGFADGPAFFRAFRRWTGTTPGAVRDTSPEDEDVV